MTSALAVLFLLALGDGVREAPPPEPVKAKALTKAPVLTEFHPAVYPPALLEAGTTADVGCQIDIGADGSVTQVIIQKSAGPEFDAAAIEAIKTFKFSPAEFDGVPAPVRIGYVYHFVIEKKLEAKPPPPPDPDLGTITGYVREAGKRIPVVGADLSIELFAPGDEATSEDDKSKKKAAPVPIATLTATSDKDGRFKFEGVPPGKRRVKAGAAEFAETSVRVTLEPKGTADLTITLRRTLPGELSATVTGEKPSDQPTRRSLSQEELRNVPGSLNDPIRAIQNLPGLARAPFLSGALLVRGSPAADTGIYLDGDKIPLLYHFLGGPSVINEQMIDRIDFYPGGTSAYYGRNLTGAIDVGTRPGEGKGFHGEASIDLIQSVGFVEFPISDDWRVAIAARRSYIDFFLPLFLPNDPKTGVTTVTPVYWDYQARVDHKLANGDSLNLIFFGSDDKLALVQSGPKQPQDISVDSHIAFHRAHGTWKHSFGPDLSFTITPAVGTALTSFDSSGTGVGANGGSQSGQLSDIALGLRSELRWEYSKSLMLRAGVDTLYDRFKVSADILTPAAIETVGANVPVSTHLERVQPFNQFGEYVEAELHLGALQLTPGLRMDQIHWRENTRPSFDPRIWGRYELTPQDALKAYVGLYHQPPTALQIDQQLGNPALDLERTVQFGLGYDKKFSDVWSAGVELFYNRKSNLVQSASAIAQPDGTIYNPRLLNTGIGRAYGAEFLLRREITSTLYGWIAYTISRSEILRKPGEQWRLFTYDQPHILTVVIGWRPSVGWELSTRYRFTSGNPTAPVIGSVFDADTGTYNVERGNFGDDRETLFSQLDARAQYTWTFDVWRLTLYLDVQNVTNRNNPEFYVYDYRFRDKGSISGIPILPTFGLMGRW
ncbi:MAG: TonB family protein [Deltaproteobacteria bacterium]|nr:TonB family protein [Deltaproteobacteria bacterium]